MTAIEHAMLREIHEQPEAIRRTIEQYVRGGHLDPQFLQELGKWANPYGEVLIAASGSSRHAGLAAEILLEDLCGLAVDVEYASEYNCRGTAAARPGSILVLSQSGETSDTLAALRIAKERGQRTLAITNHEDSTMAREATLSMPLAAGPEKAIPATKSFTCQLTALFLLGLFEAARLGKMTENEIGNRLAALEALPGLIAGQLPTWEQQLCQLATIYRPAATFLYLGRGIHYAIAREGALKLKEASYVHAEGYPAGELKHGPNALVSERTPLVVIATCDPSHEASADHYEKTVQLLRDLQKQKANVLAIVNQGDRQIPALVSHCVEVPAAWEYLLPILEVVPLQLFSYFMALEHGVDVDRPRNLSKAVIETA
jgi:glucosamine--fructose-6-phosphate aminotransferase (isomerizing)